MKTKRINRKHKKLACLCGGIVFSWIVILLILVFLKENIEYYMTPTQISEKFDSINKNKKMRIGGLVTKIDRGIDEINFTIMDGVNIVNILYHGSVTPPIFKVNVGIIARGYLIDRTHFVADELIGKHDEKYMPANVNK